MVELVRRIAKAGESGEHGCPAVYETDDPTVVVVQGVRLDRAVAAQLQQVAADETAISVPVEMLERALAGLAGAPVPPAS